KRPLQRLRQRRQLVLVEQQPSGTTNLCPLHLVHRQPQQQVLSGLLVATNVDAQHTQVVASPHKRGLELESLKVGVHRLLQPVQVGKRRTKSVPEHRVVGLDLQRGLEAVN